MELSRQPETEFEYWETIDYLGDYLGGFVWRMNYDAADGRFEMNNAIEKDLRDAREIMETLVSELFVLFGVVHPKNCPQKNAEGKMPEAPVGMIWYWDWYNKTKTEWNRAEYEKIICSACVLCEGAEVFIQKNVIPCTVRKGVLYKLRRPYQCAMVGSGRPWNEEQLFVEIRKVGGEEAINKLKAKESELKAIA